MQFAWIMLNSLVKVGYAASRGSIVGRVSGKTALYLPGIAMGSSFSLCLPLKCMFNRAMKSFLFHGLACRCVSLSAGLCHQ